MRYIFRFGGETVKNIIKKFLFKEKGSVSIYAILIILPIFLLNALFIDTMRIISAERQIENAIDTSLRSTMADYNEKLAAVGLFSYSGGQSKANGDFQKYLDEQFYDAGDLDGALNLSNPGIDTATATFETDRNLVDYDVMRHQILESMKYQAPAQIGEQLFELVNSGLGDFSEDDGKKVENLAESYEELFDLAEKRNKKIDKAKKEIEKYLDMLGEEGELSGIVGPESKDAFDEKIPKDVRWMEGLIFYNDRYHELKEKLEEEDDDDDEETEDEGDDDEDKEDDEEDIEEEIENYENALKGLKSNHLDLFDKFKSIKGTINKEIFGFVVPGSPDNYGPASAKDYNDKIEEIMEEINFDDFELDDKDKEEIEKMKNMVMRDEFFNDIYTNIEELDKQFDTKGGMSEEEALSGSYASYTVYDLVDGFHKVIEEHVDDATNIKNELKSRNSTYNTDYADPIRDHLSVYEDSKALIAEREELEEEEDKADEGIGELWEFLTKGVDNMGKDQDTYNRLEEIVSNYDAVVDNGDVDEEEPSRIQFIKDAFEQFSQFTKFVSDFPESVRNELYINEYIMANYGTSEPYELTRTDAASFMYDTKQAQFITYGHYTAGANYLAFVKDIALVLFVFKMIDLILFEGGFAGPLGILRAVVRAAGDTLIGLKSLTTGDYEYKWKPLKISGRIDMSMPLFLRIFMIMKSFQGEDYNNEKIRRLQGAITLDTDVELDKNPSYIEGTVKGDIDLLFIPALTKILPNNTGKLSGKTYTIKKSKVYSY